jgi:hypothetical protein
MVKTNNYELISVVTWSKIIPLSDKKLNCLFAQQQQ